MGVIPSNWRGSEFGIRLLKFTDLGPANIQYEIMKDDVGFSIPNDKETPTIVKDPKERLPCSRTYAFRMINFKNKSQYRIIVDNDYFASSLFRSSERT